MSTITFWQFFAYSIGGMIAPRWALAFLVLDLANGFWAMALAVALIGQSFDYGKRVAKAIVFLVNLAHHAITGRQLIVEVEKVIEKEVEKVIERVRTVTKRIAVRELSRAEAHDCLGCKDGASREDLITGYKTMIQKVHPDHGGSTVLAAMVNGAKKMLVPKA